MPYRLDIREMSRASKQSCNDRRASLDLDFLDAWGGAFQI